MKTRTLRGSTGNSDPKVTGDIASLAASRTNVVTFDLGTDWDQFEQVDVFVKVLGPSSGASNVQLFGSDGPVGDITEAPTKARRLGYQYNTTPSGVNSSITTAGGGQNIFVRPWGRYLMLSLTNADGVNAFGAGSFAAFIAFPRTSTTQ